MTPRDWIAPGVIVAIMTVWLTLSAGRFASIDNQYAAITASINELDVKLDQSINRTSASENQHADIAKAVAGLETKLDRSISATSAADNQYADIAKMIAGLETKVDRSVSAISTMDNADIAKRVTDLDAKFDRSISSLSAQLDRMAKQQAALAGQFGEIQAEVNSLKMRLESIGDKIGAESGSAGSAATSTEN